MIPAHEITRSVKASVRNDKTRPRGCAAWLWVNRETFPKLALTACMRKLPTILDFKIVHGMSWQNPDTQSITLTFKTVARLLRGSDRSPVQNLGYLDWRESGSAVIFKQVVELLYAHAESCLERLLPGGPGLGQRVVVYQRTLSRVGCKEFGGQQRVFIGRAGNSPEALLFFHIGQRPVNALPLFGEFFAFRGVGEHT